MTEKNEPSITPYESKPKYFKYPISAYRKLLPTDCSIREMAKLRKLNFRTIRSYIWYTKALRDFYESLPVNYSKNNSKRGVNPIPFEVEPYFYQYITTASSLGYGTSTFLKIPMENDKATNQEMEMNFTQEEADKITSAFGKKLIANLYNYVRSDPSAPEFFKNALFQNDAFCDQAASLLWEKEFRKRCDLLIQLVKQCPIKKRFLDLAHITYFLDAEIGAFATFSLNEKVDSEKACREFPASFPKEIFQKARAGIATKNKEDEFSYLLENAVLKVKEKDYSLEQAFSIIEGRQSNWADHLDAARGLYQKSLESIFTQSEFQEEFERLANYLAQIRGPHSDATVSSTSLNMTLSAYTPSLRMIGICRGTFRPYAAFHVDTSDPCAQFLRIYAERYIDSALQENWSEYTQLISLRSQKPGEDLSVATPPPQDAEAPGDELVALCEKYLGDTRIWCWDQIYTKEKHTSISSILSVLSQCYNIVCGNLVFSPTGLISPSALEAEWFANQASSPNQLSSYLTGNQPEFPFPGTMLHEVLFLMKFHGYIHRDSKQIASIFQNYQKFIQQEYCKP